MSDETTKYEKITPEELANLKQKHDVMYKTNKNIAHAWLTQQKCIEDLAAYRVLYDQRAKEFNDAQKAITDKYGEIEVDMLTGTIIYGGSN